MQRHIHAVDECMKLPATAIRSSASAARVSNTVGDTIPAVQKIPGQLERAAAGCFAFEAVWLLERNGVRRHRFEASWFLSLTPVTERWSSGSVLRTDALAEFVSS